MRIPLLIFLGLLLASCTGFGLDNSAFRLETTQYDDRNSGVILFRTINTNAQGKYSGFVVAFKSEGGDLYVSNKSGLSGYLGETFYALRVPEGNYFLDNFFVYGGQMKPVSEPFAFSISAGEILYVGSLIKPWTLTIGQMPKNLSDVIFKDYATRSLAGSGTPVPLMVANEGENIFYQFISRHPSLDGESIRIRLLQ